jgi:hypothetical protein
LSVPLRRLASLALALASCIPAHADSANRATVPPPRSSDARTVLGDALAAMGGQPLLAGLHSLRLTLRTVAYRIDDSERAEGPYWLTVGVDQEWRDETGGRWRREADEASAQWPLHSIIIDDGRVVARGGHWRGRWFWSGHKPSLHGELALAPERLLLTAAAATDLVRLPDRKLHAQMQQVLGFHWRGLALRLYLDADLHLPSRLEVDGGSIGSRSSVMLGDLAWRTDYLFYKRQPDGLVYPFQWNLSRNGRPYLTTVVTALQENAAAPAAGYRLPATAKLDAASIARGGSYGSEPLAAPAQGDVLQPLAKNAWLISGSWNVLVVRQSDGLVVIEAPESSAHSARVLDLLARRFPAVPVKALVSTTDSLWHIAGIRTYVARGIPIYALGANLDRLRRQIAAPHRRDPDELVRHPRVARLVGVSGAVRIGSGGNRIELYPIRGHGDERMLMAYLPGAHLLYGSSNDIGVGQPARATFNAFELVSRVDALHLPVHDYVAIHTAKMAWSAFRGIALGQPPLSSD